MRASSCDHLPRRGRTWEHLGFRIRGRCGQARNDPAAAARGCRDPCRRAGEFRTLRESEILCTQGRNPTSALHTTSDINTGRQHRRPPVGLVPPARPVRLRRPQGRRAGHAATYRLWALPARLVRHARQRVLKLSRTWPRGKGVPGLLVAAARAARTGLTICPSLRPEEPAPARSEPVPALSTSGGTFTRRTCEPDITAENRHNKISSQSLLHPESSRLTQSSAG